MITAMVPLSTVEKLLSTESAARRSSNREKFSRLISDCFESKFLIMFY